MSKHPESQGIDFARFFSTGSRSLKWLPPLDRLLVGDNIVPHGWRLLGTVADWYPAVTFKGDKKGPWLPIPRLYRTAGIMAVEACEMEELRARYPEGRHAVALKFNNALVVGALARHLHFERTIYPEHELVGVRIGRGDVAAIPGMCDAQLNSFTPAATAERFERVDKDTVNHEIPLA